jgi:putative flippase GtrA
MSLKDHRKIPRQFVSFAGVGIIGTAAHYLALFSLVKLAYLRPVAASSAGFVVGALVNYGLNYRVTFRSQKLHRETLAKFLVVAGIGMVFNSLIMGLGTEVLNQHYFYVQLVATGLVLVWNFFGNRVWTFGM